MAEEKQQAQARPGARKAKLVASPTPPEEIYVDGVIGIIPRRGVVKLDCFRVVGFDPKEKAEVHCVTHRLVLPTAALPNLVAQIRRMAGRGARRRAPAASPEKKPS